MVLKHHSIGRLTDREVTHRQHLTTGWNNIKSHMGSFAEWWETGDIAMPLNLLQTIQKLEKDGLVFSRPLLALLEESQQQRHSSDPRDKIFALLGLASDKESYIGTVDYSIATGSLRARPGRTRIVGQSKNHGIQLEGLFQGRVTDIVLMIPLWDDKCSYISIVYLDCWI
jgi:hypothetical protein